MTGTQPCLLSLTMRFLPVAGEKAAVFLTTDNTVLACGRCERVGLPEGLHAFRRPVLPAGQGPPGLARGRIYCH